MGKRRRWQIRALSFLLALIMVLQDGAALAVRAEEKNAGAVKAVQETTGSAGEETGGVEADTALGNDEKQETGVPEGKDPGTDTSGSEADTDKGGAGEDGGTDQAGETEPDTSDSGVSGNVNVKSSAPNKLSAAHLRRLL